MATHFAAKFTAHSSTTVTSLVATFRATISTFQFATQHSTNFSAFSQTHNTTIGPTVYTAIGQTQHPTICATVIAAAVETEHSP